MLLSDAVKAATLPEPLASIAVGKGARVLVSDATRRGKPVADRHRLSLRGPDQPEGRGRRLLPRLCRGGQGHQRRSRTIPGTLFVDKGRIPPFLAKTYPIPRYPLPAPFSAALYEPIIDWLAAKQLVARIPYETMVATRFPGGTEPRMITAQIGQSRFCPWRHGPAGAARHLLSGRGRRAAAPSSAHRDAARPHCSFCWRDCCGPIAAPSPSPATRAAVRFCRISASFPGRRCAQNIGLGLVLQGEEKKRIRRRVEELLAGNGPDRFRRPLPRSALRRHAAAGGHGPGPGGRAADPFYG